EEGEEEEGEGGGEEVNTRSYFDIHENMSERSKIRRFKQCTKNIELMKETDQLLMPVQVNVVPQLDYGCEHFYSSFLLPNIRHTRKTPDSDDDDDGTNDTDFHGRLDHYTNMLKSTLNEDKEDAYLAFMTTFKYYQDTVCEKEIETEQPIRSGVMEEDEAAVEMANEENGMVDMGGGFDDDDNYGGGGGDDGDEGRDPVLAPDQEPIVHRDGSIDSIARSIAAASGYGMRVSSDGGDDEGDAIAQVGDQQYHLRLIKLDTVAMKTALSDVLTNPLMVADKLDETLSAFGRNMPPPTMGKKKKAKSNLTAINEDEELELLLRDSTLDTTGESTQPDVDIEATMMEAPDALNVTRALFAPPKEKAKSNRTIVFGAEGNSSQSHANASQTSHIELQGLHTLKSTFTCLLPACPLVPLLTSPSPPPSP
ncbi:hypothetical protein PENTCL1PPCAC_30370, partial [Pristionchus entomophagus]